MRKILRTLCGGQSHAESPSHTVEVLLRLPRVTITLWMSEAKVSLPCLCWVRGVPPGGWTDDEWKLTPRI